MSVSPITCHILDTTIGRPAANVACSIFYLGELLGNAKEEATYELHDKAAFGMARTNGDGRIKNWVHNPKLSAIDKEKVGITSSNEWTQLRPGVYKIKFLTAKYFYGLRENNRTFFPFVEIVFTIDNPPDNHYHVPLLLSNYSYSTYRGS